MYVIIIKWVERKCDLDGKGRHIMSLIELGPLKGCTARTMDS